MTLGISPILAGAILLGGLIAPLAPVQAADEGSNSLFANSQAEHASSANKDSAGTASRQSDELQDAKKLVSNAVGVVKKMKTDPNLNTLLAKAKGVYIVPEFGRGAFIVGGRGGSGVVLAHKNGEWTDPAFFDFGAISIGAQAGGSAGSVAFLLMTDDALDQFMSGNKVALNAESGLSIITYSANAQASWGKGDIIFWSDTKGAYAGVTVSATDINWDDDSNRAYYGGKKTPSEISRRQRLRHPCHRTQGSASRLVDRSQAAWAGACHSPRGFCRPIGPITDDTHPEPENPISYPLHARTRAERDPAQDRSRCRSFLPADANRVRDRADHRPATAHPSA